MPDVSVLYTPAFSFTPFYTGFLVNKVPKKPSNPHFKQLHIRYKFSS